jgi:catechol 2,3-dioxygenase-like lactoylglutathione lyase family enzyme
MPIKVVELHHHGIRIGTSPEEVEKARTFYTDVLGLHTDSHRPNIPSIPGFWMYVGQGERTTQIHQGATGRSPMAQRAEDLPFPSARRGEYQEAKES